MKPLTCVALLTLAAPAWSHSPASAPEPTPLDQLLSGWGSLEEAQIKTQQLTDGLHVLFGMGGNIAVSSGRDGTLMVDDQFPELMPKIKTAIGKFGADGVDFVINTHWHFDHAQGNIALGKEGTWLVSQSNSRRMMQGEHLINLVSASYKQEPYPEYALPDITYDDHMVFHLNGQAIELWHFGPAHTTGDTAVIFRGDNAVHLGDVFNNSGYPFIDAGNGGSLDGAIRFCREVLARIDRDTVVIPGHGPVADYQTLMDYTEMLETAHRRIAALVKQGATLAEVVAAKPTAEFDERFGNPAQFVDRAYTSLTHRYIEAAP